MRAGWLHNRRGFHTRRLLLVLLCALTGLPGTGCSRQFFRRRADKEVAELLKQKDKYPDWGIDQFHVYPDSRARFADWTNPDRPPMPPDDPAAHKLSPNPQKPPKSGIQMIEGTGYLELMRHWDAENRIRLAALKEAEEAPPSEEVDRAAGEVRSPAEVTRDINARIEAELAASLTTGPAKERPAPGCEKHPFMLNLEQTVELGFLNSREFQTEREALYLTALPVTTERFAFVAQPFLTGELTRESAGNLSVDGPTRSWMYNTGVGFSKAFATGGLLLFNFANQTVYNLGGSGTTSVSTLSFDMVQPLLAGAGWAVALEPLTQVERNLLYAIRDFMRFRQQYFVFFAAGQPTFIPGVQAGVQAISPPSLTSPNPFVPGATALPTVANNAATPQVAPGAGGRLFPIAGPGPTPQGYLSTVGERAQLVNSYKNIENLERYLRLFRVYLEGGIVTEVQVGTVEQALLRNAENALNNQANYRISLDQLKQQLGLPMTVPIDLDDAPLRPMIEQTTRFESVAVDFESANNRSLSYARADEAGQLRARLRRLLLTSPVVRGTRFEKQFPKRWAAWESLPATKADEDIGPLERRLDALRAERDKLRDKQADGKAKLSDQETQRLGELGFEIELGRFERNLRIYERQPWKNVKNPIERNTLQNRLFRLMHRGFLTLIEDPIAERLEAIRRNWPDLAPVCVEGVDLLRAPEDQAMQVAQRVSLDNRLDLMNARAQLVDSWRKIRVTANSLLGVVNVDYHVDASSPLGGSQPFAVGGSTTRHQLNLNMQAPLVRILQRNNYRSALIAYQQQRRQVQLQEDQVLFEVRLDLRQLRVNANNYERIQKRQIELAYLQVDQALQAFSQPQAPPGSAAIPGLVGPTAPVPQVGDPAALTQQLLNTQNSLLSAQNELYSTWVGFLTTRMSFYRDLGVMPLDSRGVWIDDPARCDSTHAERPACSRDPHEQLPAPRILPPAQAKPLEQGR